MVGFVAVIVILSASYHPFGPEIDPGQFVYRGKIVVARHEIAPGEKITGEKLAFWQVGNKEIPEGAFRQMDAVVGRVAITPIGAREAIINMKLSPTGVGGGLSAVIPEGYRAMTITADDIVGVSSFVGPGSLVDIVNITVPGSQAGPMNALITRMVLQDIKVLASGTRNDSSENPRQRSEVNTVTVQVTPKQAEKLVLAANEGRLKVVTRQSKP
jgi:pilus assembly protein CpaB